MNIRLTSTRGGMKQKKIWQMSLDTVMCGKGCGNMKTPD